MKNVVKKISSIKNFTFEIGNGGVVGNTFFDKISHNL